MESSVINYGIASVTVHDDEDNSSTFPHSPKYTMSDKWIMDHQRKKLFVEQNWGLKQQKRKQRIATCYNRLKVGRGIST